MVSALLDQAGIANPRQGAAALLGSIQQLLASQLSEGQLERGWFWHPNRYHGLLREPERSRILWWWYAGGAGFVAVVLGLLVVAAGLWSAFRQI
jgi:cytochrome c-type biogenesis protein CcmH/NrfG